MGDSGVRKKGVITNRTDDMTSVRDSPSPETGRGLQLDEKPSSILIDASRSSLNVQSNTETKVSRKAKTGKRNLKEDNAKCEQLMSFNMKREDEQLKYKSIESLVKKLSHSKEKQHGSIEDLIMILKSEGVDNRKCVTITNTNDGRIQVGAKKLIPPVIYCQIWRFPDISNQAELKPLTICQHPYSKKMKEKEPICINPYHYDRVEPPAKIFKAHKAEDLQRVRSPHNCSPISKLLGDSTFAASITYSSDNLIPDQAFQLQKAITSNLECQLGLPLQSDASIRVDDAIRLIHAGQPLRTPLSEGMPSSDTTVVKAERTPTVRATASSYAPQLPHFPVLPSTQRSGFVPPTVANSPIIKVPTPITGFCSSLLDMRWQIKDIAPGSIGQMNNRDTYDVTDDQFIQPGHYFNSPLQPDLTWNTAHNLWSSSCPLGWNQQLAEYFSGQRGGFAPPIMNNQPIIKVPSLSFTPETVLDGAASFDFRRQDNATEKLMVNNGTFSSDFYNITYHENEQYLQKKMGSGRQARAYISDYNKDVNGFRSTYTFTISGPTLDKLEENVLINIFVTTCGELLVQNLSKGISIFVSTTYNSENVHHLPPQDCTDEPIQFYSPLEHLKRVDTLCQHIYLAQLSKITKLGREPPTFLHNVDISEIDRSIAVADEELNRQTIVHIALYEEWGPKCDKCTKIQDTPCWLEINMKTEAQ